MAIRKSVWLNMPNNFGYWSVCLLTFDDDQPQGSDERFVWGPKTICDCYEQARRTAESMAVIYECAIIDEKENEDREPSDCKYKARPICPYCKAEQSSEDVNDGDELVCGDCDETFEVEMLVEVSYSTKKLKAGGQ